MLKTALSLCYTVELDALPGIWGVAAGLMQVWSWLLFYFLPFPWGNGV